MDKQRVIPQSLEERTKLRQQIASFVEGKSLVPPVSIVQLRELAREFITMNQLAEGMEDWLMVGLHNQVWKGVIAGIPYDRRLLLLPKCLSHSQKCQGEVDELGLLCHQCGNCLIPSLQEFADNHGILSMVAEGFTSVIELFESQVIDAVIGVSCLDSLEKAFPLLVNHAVPGLAIPLNDCGCSDTHVDEAYVMQQLAIHSSQEVKLLDYDHIHDLMDKWFSEDEKQVDSLDVEDIASDWLYRDGKRWRPFLLVAVYEALTAKDELPEEVHRSALAVECFHKASLVHDDIQDADMERYGKSTVNASFGDAIAINVGDYLLGQGYQLLAACNNPQLVSAIADAHLALCKGQGMELAWMKRPTTLSLDSVLDIFRMKTVPAFEVALTLGLICAGYGETELRAVLQQYSNALGVAYQLQDDLEDDLQDNVTGQKPSAVLAIQTEHPEWSRQEVRKFLSDLAEDYHQQALNALAKVDKLELKRLLFQVTSKILR